VDGGDFQIIWEADFIVNIDEENIILEPDEVERSMSQNISTETGMKLVREVL
jgi:hypothetical protein